MPLDANQPLGASRVLPRCAGAAAGAAGVAAGGSLWLDVAYAWDFLSLTSACWVTLRDLPGDDTAAHPGAGHHTAERQR